MMMKKIIATVRPEEWHTLSSVLKLSRRFMAARKIAPHAPMAPDSLGVAADAAQESGEGRDRVAAVVAALEELARHEIQRQPVEEVIQGPPAKLPQHGMVDLVEGRAFGHPLEVVALAAGRGDGLGAAADAEQPGDAAQQQQQAEPEPAQPGGPRPGLLNETRIARHAVILAWPEGAE